MSERFKHWQTSQYLPWPAQATLLIESFACTVSRCCCFVLEVPSSTPVIAPVDETVPVTVVPATSPVQGPIAGEWCAQRLKLFCVWPTAHG